MHDHMTDERRDHAAAYDVAGRQNRVSNQRLAEL
jgi:hypothetical protein